MKALILVLVSFLAVSALAQPGPPGLCRPCLFYAGDLNPNDPQADAFPDMYTFVFPDTKTYAGILITSGAQHTCHGHSFSDSDFGVTEARP
jgi:hypothetical protein